LGGSRGKGGEAKKEKDNAETQRFAERRKKQIPHAQRHAWGMTGRLIRVVRAKKMKDGAEKEKCPTL
jgi:hypothetical protein